jgi:transcriptional regulator with XRE-family HTH domain
MDTKRKLSEEQIADAQRLKSLWEREFKGRISQEEVAYRCGWKTQGAFNQYLHGKIPIGLNALLKISRALGVDPGDISPHLASEISKGGTADFNFPQSRYVPGPANPTAAATGGVITGKFPSRKTAKGDIEIPQYDVRASMGHGQVLPSDYIDTIRHITVGAGFLLEQGVSYTKPDNLAVITGFGESMSKTFSSGDPLIIDQGVTTVVTDGVYLFTLGAELFVKRLQRVPGGVRVISDSDAYPPFEVTGRDIDSLVIHARVLLAWRSQRL